MMLISPVYVGVCRLGNIVSVSSVWAVNDVEYPTYCECMCVMPLYIGLLKNKEILENIVKIIKLPDGYKKGDTNLNQEIKKN